MMDKKDIKMTVVTVSGANQRTCIVSAWKHLGYDRRDMEVYLISGGDDGLYRAHLPFGVVVEMTLVRQSRTIVHNVCCV